MDRRKFLQLSSLSIAALAINSETNLLKAKKPSKKPAQADGEYSVVMLGDTHYDKDETYYHAGYCLPDNPTREENHRKEFKRNADMWQQRCPKIVARARALVDDSTKAFFQMGDIIQGDTATAEIHTKFLNDTVNFLKSHLGRLPFVTVVGNHDVRGNDDSVCEAAYKEYMTGRMGAELGQQVTSTNFSFWIGPDVYICIDFNKPNDEEVERLFAESENARYTFVLVHAPVFPYIAKTSYNWIYLGRKATPERREKMNRLMARRNTIVLCGHTHLTEFYDWYGYDGRITQMTLSSVWAKPEQGVFSVISENPETYTVKSHDDWFEPIRKGLKGFFRSYSIGCYKLRVSDSGVYVDFYAGDSEKVSKTFVIR